MRSVLLVVSMRRRMLRCLMLRCGLMCRLLLLLAISPAFHHRVFSRGCLSQAMVVCSLYGCNGPTRVLLRMCLFHRHLPCVASIVLGIPRVELVGEIVVR
jgi:hypothetical protein